MKLFSEVTFITIITGMVSENFVRLYGVESILLASLHEEVDGGDGTPLVPVPSDLSRASEELPDVAGAVGGMGDQTQVTDPILGSLPGIHHHLIFVYF